MTRTSTESIRGLEAPHPDLWADDPPLPSPSDEPAVFSPEHLSFYQDSRFLGDLLVRGELTQYRKEYVLAYGGKIVGHGRDLAAVRKQAATVLGVAEHLIVAFYIG